MPTNYARGGIDVMPRHQTSRADDELLLTMLDMRDHEGVRPADIAAQVGKSKSAVCGLFHRVRVQEVGGECRKPENREGGMPRKWWAE
jgi:hypothetical protein